MWKHFLRLVAGIVCVAVAFVAIRLQAWGGGKPTAVAGIVTVAFGLIVIASRIRRRAARGRYVLAVLGLGAMMFFAAGYTKRVNGSERVRQALETRAGIGLVFGVDADTWVRNHVTERPGPGERGFEPAASKREGVEAFRDQEFFSDGRGTARAVAVVALHTDRDSHRP